MPITKRISIILKRIRYRHFLSDIKSILFLFKARKFLTGSYFVSIDSAKGRKLMEKRTQELVKRLYPEK